MRYLSTIFAFLIFGLFTNISIQAQTTIEPTRIERLEFQPPPLILNPTAQLEYWYFNLDPTDTNYVNFVYVTEDGLFEFQIGHNIELVPTDTIYLSFWFDLDPHRVYPGYPFTTVGIKTLVTDTIVTGLEPFFQPTVIYPLGFTPYNISPDELDTVALGSEALKGPPILPWDWDPNDVETTAWRLDSIPLIDLDSASYFAGNPPGFAGDWGSSGPAAAAAYMTYMGGKYPEIKNVLEVAYGTSEDTALRKMMVDYSEMMDRNPNGGVGHLDFIEGLLAFNDHHQLPVSTHFQSIVPTLPDTVLSPNTAYGHYASRDTTGSPERISMNWFGHKIKNVGTATYLSLGWYDPDQQKLLFNQYVAVTGMQKTDSLRWRIWFLQDKDQTKTDSSSLQYVHAQAYVAPDTLSNPFLAGQVFIPQLSLFQDSIYCFITGVFVQTYDTTVVYAEEEPFVEILEVNQLDFSSPFLVDEPVGEVVFRHQNSDSLKDWFAWFKYHSPDGLYNTVIAANIELPHREDTTTEAFWFRLDPDNHYGGGYPFGDLNIEIIKEDKIVTDPGLLGPGDVFYFPITFQPHKEGPNHGEIVNLGPEILEPILPPWNPDTIQLSARRYDWPSPFDLDSVGYSPDTTTGYNGDWDNSASSSAVQNFEWLASQHPTIDSTLNANYANRRELLEAISDKMDRNNNGGVTPKDFVEALLHQIDDDEIPVRINYRSFLIPADTIFSPDPRFGHYAVATNQIPTPIGPDDEISMDWLYDKTNEGAGINAQIGLYNSSLGKIVATKYVPLTGIQPSGDTSGEFWRIWHTEDIDQSVTDSGALRSYIFDVQVASDTFQPAQWQNKILVPEFSFPSDSLIAFVTGVVSMTYDTNIDFNPPEAHFVIEEIFQVDFESPFEQSNTDLGGLQCIYFIPNVLYFDDPQDTPPFLYASIKDGDSIYPVIEVPLPIFPDTLPITIHFNLDPGNQYPDTADFSQILIAYTVDTAKANPVFTDFDTLPVVPEAYRLEPQVDTSISLPDQINDFLDTVALVQTPRDSSREVFRGCEVPNIDLDGSTHGPTSGRSANNNNGGYAGDVNACGPAAKANSIMWLRKQHPEIDSLLTPTYGKGDTSHRGIMEDISEDMGRDTAGAGVLVSDFIRGSLEFADDNKLPLSTKFQSNGIDDDIDSPNPDYGHSADNQNDPAGAGKPNGKVTLEWIYNEMKNGEDVELYVYWVNGETGECDQAHYVVLDGIEQDEDGSWWIYTKDDKDQDSIGGTEHSVEEIVQFPDIPWFPELSGAIYIPSLNFDNQYAFVHAAFSESYDPSVTFEKETAFFAIDEAFQVDFESSFGQSNTDLGGLQCDYFISNLAYFADPLDRPPFLYASIKDGDSIYPVIEVPLPIFPDTLPLTIHFDLDPGDQYPDTFDHQEILIAYLVDTAKLEPVFTDFDTLPVVPEAYRLEPQVDTSISLPDQINDFLDTLALVQTPQDSSREVFRGCDVPNIDLDGSTHGPTSGRSANNNNGGYAGDVNACGPAAKANSIMWLRKQHPEIDSLLTPTYGKGDTSHRGIMEDISEDMGRDTAGAGVLVSDFIRGSLEFADDNKLPLSTKFQSNGIDDDIDSPNPDYDHSADNQNDPAGAGKPNGKVTLEWIYNEMKNGEDVELYVYWVNGETGECDQAHYVVLDGIEQDEDGSWWIYTKDDKDQDSIGGTEHSVEEIVQFPDIPWLPELSGAIYIPSLNFDNQYAFVHAAFSESYDPSVTFEKETAFFAIDEAFQVDFESSFGQSNTDLGGLQCDYFISNLAYFADPLDRPPFLYASIKDGDSIYPVIEVPLPIFPDTLPLTIHFDLDPGDQYPDTFDHQEILIAYLVDTANLVPVFTGFDTLPVVPKSYRLEPQVDTSISLPDQINDFLDTVALVQTPQDSSREVFRGCDVPNIDLDGSTHGPTSGRSSNNNNGGYAGDVNACGPAAKANSIMWLRKQHPEIDSLLTPTYGKGDTSHRGIMEDISEDMGRDTAGAGVLVSDFIRGSLEFADDNKLPLSTKFQSNGIDDDIDSPNPDYGHSADNQNDPGGAGKPNGKVTLEWIYNEMKNGEDVELYVYWVNGETGECDQAHYVVLDGIEQDEDGSWWIYTKDDKDQDSIGGTEHSVEEIVQFPDIPWLPELSGAIYIPSLNFDNQYAFVHAAFSESYDPSVTFEKEAYFHNEEIYQVDYLVPYGEPNTDLGGWTYSYFIPDGFPLIELDSVTLPVFFNAVTKIGDSMVWSINNAVLNKFPDTLTVTTHFSLDPYDQFPDSTEFSEIIFAYSVDTGISINMPQFTDFDTMPITQRTYRMGPNPDTTISIPGQEVEEVLDSLKKEIAKIDSAKSVTRGCDVPNIDLDNSTHPATGSGAGDYAGDLNACGPAAKANSIMWLRKKHKEIDDKLTPIYGKGDTSHRKIMEDLSEDMNRDSAGGVLVSDFIKGSLDFIDDTEIPVKVKFQSNGIDDNIDSPNPDYGHEAENQNDPGGAGKPHGKVTLEWIYNELKNGEDVEIYIYEIDLITGKCDNAHWVVLDGLTKVNNHWNIEYKHDDDQEIAGGDIHVSEDIIQMGDNPTFPDLSGAIHLPSYAWKDYHWAFVHAAVSESYDPNVTFDEIFLCADGQELTGNISSGNYGANDFVNMHDATVSSGSTVNVYAPQINVSPTTSLEGETTLQANSCPPAATLPFQGWEEPWGEDFVEIPEEEPQAMEELGDRLRLYPNPARDFISYQLPGGVSFGEEVEVRIFRHTGQLVKYERHFYSGGQVLDIAGLEVGLYFVQVISERRRWVVRVVVVR